MAYALAPMFGLSDDELATNEHNRMELLTLMFLVSLVGTIISALASMHMETRYERLLGAQRG
jgi:hypothetical protein